ncbi:MAG TPA: mRNA surveillance protein pelota, partial [Thermoplasmatales archaeon]|nr:mRNA surveillance protein pelota [Thermoplasmatales archaeon]
MRVVFKDLKRGIVKLIPENMDDLWHLYNIIEKGDLVRALTFRTAEQKGDKIRAKKGEKKPMVLTIRVENVEFHDFSDRLRIHGIIEEGPQDIGSHHTINLKVGDYKEITIVKERWGPHHLKRIDEALRSRGKNDVIVVSLDDEEACIAVIRNSGVQV